MFHILLITVASLSTLLTGSPLSAITDFQNIYNDEFRYQLPESVLRNYYQGTAFDWKTPYNNSELQRLNADIAFIYQQVMASKPEQKREIVLTAGAPGAGKTTLQKQHLRTAEATGRRFAYICPDDVCLRQMKQTYHRDLATTDASTCYNKWRPGSNAANHLILANLIKEGRAIYFGTTSTSPHTPAFFAFLKEQGYRIHLLHLVASDEVRWLSITKHDVYHTTEQDIREKGMLLPQRINSCYLKYADRIDFYLREDVDQNATWAATWERGGKLKILEAETYNRLKSTYNSICERLPDHSALLWENSIERLL